MLSPCAQHSRGAGQLLSQEQHSAIEGKELEETRTHLPLSVSLDGTALTHGLQFPRGRQRD